MEAVRKLYMTDSEIEVSFRQARNRAYQVRVLAELNVCSESLMLDKLDNLGFDTSPYRQHNKARKVRYEAWTDGQIELMLRLRDEKRQAWKVIAATLGRSPEACADKYSRLKGV